jgi:hypothetical protein
VEGQRGVCVSLSSRGGLVELEAPWASAGAQRVEIALGLEAGAPLALRGRIVRSEGAKMALAWDGESVAALDALEVFLAARQAARAARRRPFWGRAEALRT